MKMNFKYVSMMACAAMMAAFTSCSNDDANVPNPVDEGAEARLSFSFTLPQSNVTRAADNSPIAGVGKENDIKSIQVFIFKADGTAATGNGTEFSNIATQFDVVDGQYTLKEENRIKTTSGKKNIYIAANVTSSAATEQALKEEAIAWTNLIKLDASDKMEAIAMCSQAIEKTLIAQEENTSDPTANTAKGTLERLVSKVTVSTSSSSFDQTIATGDPNEFKVEYTIKDWALGLVNKSVYLAQNLSATGELVTPQDTRGTRPTADGDFKAINSAFASDDALKNVTVFDYVGENAPANGLYGEATYTMVRTKAVPKKVAFVDAATPAKISWKEAAASDFTGGTFWFVTNAKKEICFAATKENAEAVAGNLEAPRYIYEYKGGYAYFIVTLNEQKTGKEGVIYRNQFVHVTVNGIAPDIFGGMPGLGDDGLTPPNPEDKDKVPDPFDPKEPIVEKNAYLLIDVSVAPWVYSDNTVVLQ